MFIINNGGVGQDAIITEFTVNIVGLASSWNEALDPFHDSVVKTGTVLNLSATIGDVLARDVYIRHEGSQFWVSDSTEADTQGSTLVHEYKMTTDNTLSTAVFVQTKNLGTSARSVRGISWAETGGTKMHLVRSGPQLVVQYDTTALVTAVDVGEDSDEIYINGGEARLCVTTINGLACLEGWPVGILEDGNVGVAVTVEDFKITIPDGRCIARAAIGLPYTTDIETLDVETQDVPDTIQGKYKKISQVMIRFYKSRMPLIGPNSGDMTEVKLREFEKYGEHTNLLTGDKHVIIPPSWNSNGRIFIRNIHPVPLTILGIFPDLTLEDELD